MALGDAILACLTERPMTGYELAKTFDTSIGFFWKADHQQIYRELSKLRDRGHVQAREVVQTGKPNKLVYTLTSEGRAALKHWAARPSRPASIKDDLLVRMFALDGRRHRMRCAPTSWRASNTTATARTASSGSWQNAFRRARRRQPISASCSILRLGVRHERAVVEWCEEALEVLSDAAASATVTPIEDDRREGKALRRTEGLRKRPSSLSA